MTDPPKLVNTLGLVINTGGQPGSAYNTCLVCGANNWKGSLIHKPGCAKLARAILKLRAQP